MSKKNLVVLCDKTAFELDLETVFDGYACEHIEVFNTDANPRFNANAKFTDKFLNYALRCNSYKNLSVSDLEGIKELADQLRSGKVVGHSKIMFNYWDKEVKQFMISILDSNSGDFVKEFAKISKYAAMLLSQLAAEEPTIKTFSDGCYRLLRELKDSVTTELDAFYCG